MEAPTTEPEKADYILRGSVTCDGTGLVGVTVSLGNGRTAVTDANGAFELTELAAGDYLATFTPARAVGDAECGKPCGGGERDRTGGQFADAVQQRCGCL